MRHNIERYRLLLRTESNLRARRVLIDMITELESRPILAGIPIPAAKDGPPVVRRHIGSATPVTRIQAEVPVAITPAD